MADSTVQTAPGNAIRDIKQEMNGRVAGVPIQCRKTLQRALLGEGSPRNAIKAKCQDCVGYEEIRDRISTCTISRCPLWRFRPYQKRA